MNTFIKQALQFFMEAYNELRKVTWLSKREAIASTVVIVLLIIVVAIFVGFTDFILARILAVLL